MNVARHNRTICQYNLRGQCKFGKKCRNIHEKPESLMECLGLNIIMPPHSNQTAMSQTEGACALSPSRTKSLNFKVHSTSNNGGPSTSKVTKSLSILAIAEQEEEEEKTCGICFDVVLKKPDKSEQTFGMLPNCSHCFCFSCIRKWRQSKEFDLEVSKACPECRVSSDYVFPIRFWIDTKEAKEKYIDKRKHKMKLTDCRYFKKGKGKCPFGNTCMFLHALPNGMELDVGPPMPRRRTPGLSADDLMHQIVFWLNEDVIDDDDTFELDFDDPYVAYQYYVHDDERRYLSWDTLMNNELEDESLSEGDMFFY